MCDYSLEMYRSRPAVAGERYESRRFASGTVGFVAPGDAATAVCMACDTRVELSAIPTDACERLALPDSARVTFVRVETGPHHDAFRFDDGRELTLQQLGPGIIAHVVDALTDVPPVQPRREELVPVD